MPSSSCFTEGRFTRGLRPTPERPSPQAVTVKLTAKFWRFIAALRSRPDRVTARVTGERALCQIQFGLHRTAARTGLARRKPAIGHHDLGAGDLRLIEELTPEFEEPAIHDGPRETPVPGHAFHVQVLDPDPGETPDQHRGERPARVAAPERPHAVALRFGPERGPRRPAEPPDRVLTATPAPIGRGPRRPCRKRRARRRGPMTGTGRPPSSAPGGAPGGTAAGTGGGG